MIYAILELLLVFVSFFLPNIIMQPFVGNSNLLESPGVLGFFTVVCVLQFLFMCFIVKTTGMYSFDEIGLIKIKRSDLTRILLASVGICIVYFLFAFIVSVLPSSIRDFAGSGYRWKIGSAWNIPLIVVFSIVTGYREEFLFRAYILTMLSRLGSPVLLSVCMSSLLFGFLHAYEGIAACVFAVIAGFYFSFLFVKTKNLHIIAIAHGLYNALILILSLFV